MPKEEYKQYVYGTSPRHGTCSLKGTAPTFFSNTNQNQFMKILHTSDWHLGHMFEGVHDRTEEFRYFFSQLETVVKRESPDVLLLSGDIFNSSIPSASAEKLYTDSLLSIKEACPAMDMIITAGNHDSASHIDADGELWKIAGVRVVGGIGRETDPLIHSGRHIIPVGGSSSPKGYVIAIPFSFPRNYPLLDEATPTSQREKDFVNMLLSECAKMNRDNLPVVVMMHTTVSGCDYSDKGSIGGIETVNLGDISPTYDYMALGHIHTPQTLGKARYCGSPIPISFSEEFTHSVSVVEIPSHGADPIIKEEKIDPLFKVRTVPKEPTDVKGTIDFVKNLPEENAYLRIMVKCESFIPSLEQKAIKDAVPFGSLRVCQIVPVRENAEKKKENKMTVAELSNADPVDIASRHYKSKFGDDLPEELREMLRKVYLETKDNI